MSENTWPGGNKSDASVNIILSTSKSAFSCKVYTSEENLPYECYKKSNKFVNMSKLKRMHRVLYTKGRRVVKQKKKYGSMREGIKGTTTIYWKFMFIRQVLDVGIANMTIITLDNRISTLSLGSWSSPS